METNWPYNEDDFMELGTTGWVAVGEGLYRNIKTGHIIDSLGIEYDENGNIIKEDVNDSSN